MRKWRALGQAFENVGSDLSMACENVNCLLLQQEVRERQDLQRKS